MVVAPAEALCHFLSLSAGDLPKKDPLQICHWKRLIIDIYLLNIYAAHLTIEAVYKIYIRSKEGKRTINFTDPGTCKIFLSVTQVKFKHL